LVLAAKVHLDDAGELSVAASATPSHEAAKARPSFGNRATAVIRFTVALPGLSAIHLEPRNHATRDALVEDGPPVSFSRELPALDRRFVDGLLANVRMTLSR
jgi:hypothetical protein